MKLYVKNFGKIEEAEIDLNKFNIFLGDNNSGKSYLMSLIYGLMTIDFSEYINNTDFSKCEDFNKLKDRLESLFTEQENKNIIDNLLTKISLSDAEKTKLEELFTKSFKKHIMINNESIMKEILDYIPNIINYTLQHNKEKIIKDIFNFDIEIGEIKLLKTSYEQKTLKGIHGYGSSHLENGDFEMITKDFVSINLHYFDFRLPDATYLPIARTGFLLLKNYVTVSSYKNTFTPHNKKSWITKPCLDFVSRLSTLDTSCNNEKFIDIVKYMEKDILHGEVIIETEFSNNFYFKPDSTNKKLNMHVSSGVVTELTSLIAFLKHSENLDMLIMEEPETCLHPALQLKIAKCLIRLYNKGLPILISTHSDIILQHINNIYNLTKHPAREDLMKNKKYNYTKEDLIDIEDMNLYQFDTKNDKTTIAYNEEIFDENCGFKLNTFIKPLTEIANAALDFAYEKEEADDYE